MKKLMTLPEKDHSSVQAARPFKPYQQGGMDCLCGIYALMNSVKYLRGCGNSRTYSKLMTNILEHLKRKGRISLITRITQEGTWLEEIASVLKHVICPQYNIKRAKPYHHNPDTTIEVFILHCQGFLEQKKGIILIGIGGLHDHWTLIYCITETRLLLQDSSQLKYLGKQYCCLPNQKPQKTHVLYPTHTYFLWVE